MAGRIVACKLLKVMRHGQLLAISAFCALFGCTALLAAGNRFGVIVGILLTGAGFPPFIHSRRSEFRAVFRDTIQGILMGFSRSR